MENFVLEELLGEGSFGTVFKVKRKIDNKTYAMKQICVDGISYEDVQKAFNEIRFLASIHHPNIVGFHESFLAMDKICIILELCCDGDLAQEIESHMKENTFFDEATIWNYLIQILEALKILHSHNIAHRDVKPANCFLGSGKRIKLGDMNISARLKDGVLLKTQRGTPFYMSPEIWGNKPYDTSSDIWATGVLVYELCTLRKPFTAGNFKHLQYKIMNVIYPPIEPRISKGLVFVVSSLLQKESLERPTAKQILDSKLIKLRRTSDTHSYPLELLGTVRVPENFTVLDLDKQVRLPFYPEVTVAPSDCVATTIARSPDQRGEIRRRIQTDNDVFSRFNNTKLMLSPKTPLKSMKVGQEIRRRVQTDFGILSRLSHTKNMGFPKTSSKSMKVRLDCSPMPLNEPISSIQEELRAHSVFGFTRDTVTNLHPTDTQICHVENHIYVLSQQPSNSKNILPVLSAGNCSPLGGEPAKSFDNNFLRKKSNISVSTSSVVQRNEALLPAAILLSTPCQTNINLTATVLLSEQQRTNCV